MGVDIVEINQVVMLRPTQSPIVFIQQLGRGLRKADGKEYVVIIDFIGNYNNNFMIPIALSGDRTYNKDNTRRYIMEGSRIIPGASTVHFDEISKQRIFDSIDKSSLRLAMLKEKYGALRDRMGRIPSIVDFYKQGEIDPMLFIEYTRESYHAFLKRVEPYYKVLLTSQQEEMLSFVSQLLVNGKRPHELLILQSMLKGDANDCSDANHFKKTLENVGGKFREEYNKLETISKSTQYLDYFINEQMFNWMTRKKSFL